MKFHPSFLCLFAALPALSAAPAAPPLPAAQRLPTGQVLRPAGRSVPLGGTMAMGVLTVPGTSRAVAICSGARQALTTVDTTAAKSLFVLPYQTLDSGRGYTPTGSVYYGLALAPDHATLFAAGGSADTIGIYHLDAAGQISPIGMLNEPQEDEDKAHFPAGIALNGPGSRLYAANNLADSVSVFDVPGRKLLGSVPVGSYPLAVAALADGSKVYVSSERDSEVTVVDPVALTRRKDIRVGAHPDALLLSANQQHLYVANGDGDTVSVVGTATDTVLHTIVLRPTEARGLPGATPTGLALSSDGRTMYVSLADMNAVAVVSLALGGGDGQVRGYIPAGWYPTGVAVSPDGRHLFVSNAKGSAARVPNPDGPAPYRRDSTFKDHYILESTLSVIAVPTPKMLAAETRQTLVDNSVSAPVDAETPAVTRHLQALPIHHVIYIIKENRTYDQVLGDVKEGNGDPALALFGANVTPNLHALAEKFVLLDNFYDCAEVSPDGWNWSTSGLAEEYTQRTVPENYGERRGSPRPSVRTYDYEGENRDEAVSLAGKPDVAESPGGYIWDDVARHGLPYRNYGSFLTDDDQPDKPALVGHTCPNFAPFNMRYADSDAWVTLGIPSPGLAAYGPDKMPSRYTAWKQEFDGFVKNGDLPAFELVRMPRDHTAGTAPGNDSPRAMAADNDYGVGEIVQAVSHSPYWKNTAIFVVEDDAQNGPDHVDCHRSTAYVLSAYTQNRGVDHHFYNTDSLLRTMEILLHIPPMTRLDAIAPPLHAFTAAADLTPYTAILPDKTLLAQKNTRDSYGAAFSRRMNFAVADDAPEDALNEILWHSIKGPHVPMPAIRHGIAVR